MRSQPRNKTGQTGQFRPRVRLAWRVARIGGCFMAFGKKSARPMVARRYKRHAPRPSEFLLRQPWTDIASEPVPETSARIMNRRIRNRSYGGVGGRRGRPRLLPDYAIRFNGITFATCFNPSR